MYIETYLGYNYECPGSQDNPMRPVLYIDPNDGEEKTAHYNDRNLITNRDYQDAGFTWQDGKGWCVWVDVILNPLILSLVGIPEDADLESRSGISFVTMEPGDEFERFCDQNNIGHGPAFRKDIVKGDGFVFTRSEPA